jgi:hypothetical protein
LNAATLLPAVQWYCGTATHSVFPSVALLLLSGAVREVELTHWNLCLDRWLASIIAPNLQKLSFGGCEDGLHAVGHHAAILYSTLQLLRDRSPRIHMGSVHGNVSVCVDDASLACLASGDVEVMNNLQLACTGGYECSDEGIETAIQVRGVLLGSGLGLPWLWCADASNRQWSSVHLLRAQIGPNNAKLWEMWALCSTLSQCFTTTWVHIWQRQWWSCTDVIGAGQQFIVLQL